MDIIMWLLLILIGIGIGVIASLFGIGGGFLLIPTMVLILGMETHITVGTVSFVIMFMALSSTIAYARQKRIDYLVAGVQILASVLGAYIGALTTQLVTGKFILVSFGVVESILAIILGLKKTPAEKLQADLKKQQNLNNNREKNSDVNLNKMEKDTPDNNKEKNNSTANKEEKIKRNTPNHRFSKNNENNNNKDIKSKKWYILHRKIVDKDGEIFEYKSNILLATPLSFLAGFLSSLLGLGGGTLYIQVYVFLCGMPIHLAIAASMFTIFVSRISGSIAFITIGMIDYVVGFALVIGNIIGAQIGAWISKKIHSKYLKPMAAIMIILIAMRMIYFALVQT